MAKKVRIGEESSLKVIKMNEDNPGYTPLFVGKPVRITKVRDAKRLLSKLILGFQKGEIKNQDAKDLTYMLISYVNICTQVDFETRLRSLEEQTKR